MQKLLLFSLLTFTFLIQPMMIFRTAQMWDTLPAFSISYDDLNKEITAVHTITYISGTVSITKRTKNIKTGVYSDLSMQVCNAGVNYTCVGMQQIAEQLGKQNIQDIFIRFEDMITNLETTIDQFD